VKRKNEDEGMTKKALLVVWLMVGIGGLGWVGCADGSSPTQPTVGSTTPPPVTASATTYELSGTVTDALTGSPLRGADVRILGGNYEITSTNPAGQYAFGHLSKADGRVNVEAAMGGYQAKGDQVPGTENVIRDFQLAR
jgi:hypothetical protein